MDYIATFYSHFGAIRFKKQCEKEGISAKLMPVPRELSSSCGTCVSYNKDSYELAEMTMDELEQVVCKQEAGYKVVYCAD